MRNFLLLTGTFFVLTTVGWLPLIFGGQTLAGLRIVDAFFGFAPLFAALPLFLTLSVLRVVRADFRMPTLLLHLDMLSLWAYCAVLFLLFLPLNFILQSSLSFANQPQTAYFHPLVSAGRMLIPVLAAGLLFVTSRFIPAIRHVTLRKFLVVACFWWFIACPILSLLLYPLPGQLLLFIVDFHIGLTWKEFCSIFLFGFAGNFIIFAIFLLIANFIGSRFATGKAKES